MISLVLDNLSHIEEYSYLIPQALDVLAVFFWAYLIKRLKLNPSSSYKMSLRLFGLSALLLILTLNIPSAIAAEYGYIIFLVGLLHTLKKFIDKRRK